MNTLNEHVFVYGTLKRGQCREDCWPLNPLSVEAAWTVGSLCDLGPYPALVVGSDRVLGELWSFAVSDVAAVFKVLDQIEGTNQPGRPNEYDRVRVPVTSWERGELLASVYRYADQGLTTRTQPMPANRLIDGHYFVQWPDGATLDTSEPWRQSSA